MKFYSHVGLLITILASSNAIASNEKFSECKGEQLKNFIASTFVLDVSGIVKAIDDDAKCYKLLDPNDPKTKEIVEWNKFISHIRQINEDCGGCAL